jgi:hypothetical protein
MWKNILIVIINKIFKYVIVYKSIVKVKYIYKKKSEEQSIRECLIQIQSTR